MVINLKQGFGDFEEYKLFKFPDNSIKFELKQELEEAEEVVIETTFRTSDDIFALGLVASTIRRMSSFSHISCTISYMMYQQDDRRFKENESFGLKFIADILNTYDIDMYEVYHPHSDKIELIHNVFIHDNTEFIEWAISDIQNTKKDLIPVVWTIPDSGAFKTQFKQIEKLQYPDFITCMKSRDHGTGEIKTIVNCNDLGSKEIFIVDDICLGGRTFINIAQELDKKNCGKKYLIISHGIFSHGIIDLIKHFDCIYTTDSICSLPESDKLKIFKL